MGGAKISVFETVSVKASALGSRYRGRPGDRVRLVGFLDANGWFGQTPVTEDGELYMEPSGVMEERLLLWLKAYGCSDREKTVILLDAFQEKFPVTCRNYRRFMEKNSNASARTDLCVLDYIFSEIDREITMYDEEGLQPLLCGSTGVLNSTCRNRFLEFISSMDGKGITLDYRYESAGGSRHHQDTDAYTMEEFSHMAVLIFSRCSWEENCLVEKACAGRSMADMWLFLSLHFVCALRAADIYRLPAVRLPREGREMRAAVLEGRFTEEDAAPISRQWMQEIGAFYRPPGKTAEKTGIPGMKVFIPKTVEGAFGIILTLAASHHPGMLIGTPLHAAVTRGKLLGFFGRGWPMEGRRGFRSRNANKAYLQGIELSAGEDGDMPGRAKGYMLAALARSHKGGIGTLPAQTSVYLKDASFSGHKPEFILREMFERGIFGFVPVMLLEAIDRKKYRSLPVRTQTELISSLGLDAWQIENISSAVSRAKARGKEAISVILTEADSVRRESLIFRMLQKLGAEEAPAKHDFFLCARTAAGMACPFPGRSSCIGCGAEVYTKEAFGKLVEEYRYLCGRYRGASGWEAARLSRILEEGIMPVIALTAESIGKLFPDADLSVYLEMLEEGVSDAGTGVGR